MQVWFVTGASRGFGLEIARCVLERGDALVAAVRDPEGLREALGEVGASERFLPVALDVTRAESVETAVEQALTRFSRIDVLVNNAGRGIIGAVEEVSDSEARGVFDVNVFGVHAVTRAVLPTMRAQGSGLVVMMSSMGGVTQPGSGWGVYGASKFALEGLSEALRHEVGPLGIDVMVVEPGGFRTDFLDSASLRLAAARLPAYEATSGLTREGSAARNHHQVGDPVRAARAIVQTASAPDRPFRLPLGADAVRAIENKIAWLRADVDAGRATALGTSYPTERPEA